MDGYYFDQDAATRAVDFVETVLTHTKGEWAGKPLKLEQWQKDKIFYPLFGWKRADGTRKYRKAFIFIPRKNGKSIIAASLALYALIADGEAGAEVYSVATDREQARLVFDMAKNMVLRSQSLGKVVQAYQYSLYFSKTNSSYKYLSAEADTKHGFNTHLVVYDELHAAQNRDLYDVFDTSMGSRRQPLFVMITTAGYDANTICYEQYDYACKVRDGIIEDETFLPVIYQADAGDDIFSEETWKKANPNYGVSIYPEYIADQARKAKSIPSYENTFRRLHLNQWTASEVSWISDEDWCGCDFGEVDTTGMPCYGGLDLASTRDITAISLIFPMDDDRIVVKSFFFAPESAIKERSGDTFSYQKWVKNGEITTTPGNVTDYNFVKSKIMQLCDRYEVRGIAYDRWNATQLVIDLQQEGVKMVQWGQGFASMSAPTKELERMVMTRSINHEGNEVLRWMCSNVSIKTDPAGNLKIDKSRSTEKVDGMVALVMALGLKMSEGGDGSRSAYEDKDILTL